MNHIMTDKAKRLWFKLSVLRQQLDALRREIKFIKSQGLNFLAENLPQYLA